MIHTMVQYEQRSTPQAVPMGSCAQLAHGQGAIAARHLPSAAVLTRINDEGASAYRTATLTQ